MVTRFGLLLCLLLLTGRALAQESWFLEPQNWRIEMIRICGGSSLIAAGVVITPEGIRKLENPLILFRTDQAQILNAGEELYKANSASIDTKLRTIQKELSFLKTEYTYLKYYACGFDARTIILTTPQGRQICTSHHAFDSPFDPEIAHFLQIWQSLLRELPREMALKMDRPASHWKRPEDLSIDGLHIGQSLSQAETLFGSPIHTTGPPKHLGDQLHCRYSNGNQVIAYGTSVQAAKGKVMSYRGSTLKAGMTREEIEEKIQTDSLGWLRENFLRFDFDDQGTLDWIFVGASLDLLQTPYKP